MKKVYAVFGHWAFEGLALVAVFSSRKKAVEAMLKEEQKNVFHDVSVKEIVIDEYKEL
jgi:hypothetical protein